MYGLIDPQSKMIRYVGRTTQGQKRFHQHSYAARNCRSNTHVNNWIRSLYAKGLRFEPTILEFTDRATLIERERWWIRYGRMSGWDLTNLTEGGDGIPGYVVPESTRQKLREAHSTPEAVARIKALHTGRKRSDETRRRIGDASKGRKPNAETRQKQSTAHRGLKHTEETKTRIKEAHTGKKFSVEHVANMSKVRMGKLASPETRQRMREAQLARWAKTR